MYYEWLFRCSRDACPELAEWPRNQQSGTAGSCASGRRGGFGEPRMELTLLPLIDDQKCFETVRRLRWPTGVTCPHCESMTVTKRGMDETQACRQRYHCGGCHRQFDDLTGTVFAGHLHASSSARVGWHRLARFGAYRCALAGWPRHRFRCLGDEGTRGIARVICPPSPLVVAHPRRSMQRPGHPVSNRT